MRRIPPTKYIHHVLFSAKAASGRPCKVPRPREKQAPPPPSPGVAPVSCSLPCFLQSVTCNGASAVHDAAPPVIAVAVAVAQCGPALPVPAAPPWADPCRLSGAGVSLESNEPPGAASGIPVAVSTVKDIAWPAYPSRRHETAKPAGMDGRDTRRGHRHADCPGKRRRCRPTGLPPYPSILVLH